MKRRKIFIQRTAVAASAIAAAGLLIWGGVELFRTDGGLNGTMSESAGRYKSFSDSAGQP